MLLPGILALMLQSPVPTCGTGVEAWPTRKWEIADPAAVGMNADSLRALSARARGMPGVTSLMVVRHGKVVLEEYYHGGSRGQPVPVASITKSVTSLLVGIAIAQRRIDSVGELLAELVPQVAPPAGDPASRITVRDLLTMTSGLSEQWYLEKPLRLRVLTAPGTHFRYSNEAVQFLIRALGESTGQNTLKYSRTFLWKPLDIDVDETRWPPFERNGSGDGAAGLLLTTRELAKLGLLALREGCWEGREVVPAGYLRDAMRKEVDAGSGPEPEGRGYGYLFWIAPDGIPYMAGQGGQFVTILSDLDVVAVITARADVPEPDYPGQFHLVSDGVRAAIQP